MSFPSCIKIPPTKHNSSSQTNHHNDASRESISYEELIVIANSVFGEGRWSHAITSQTVDFVEYVMGKYQIGCAAFVRVQTANGTFHEDMGYSNTESSVKGLALQSARSTSIAVALKKALLCFGGIMEATIRESLSGKLKKQDEIKSDKEKKSESMGKLSPLEGNFSETKILENFSSSWDEASKIEKTLGKPIDSLSTPTRKKSPQPVEKNDKLPHVNNGTVSTKDCQASDSGANNHTNLPNKDGPSVTMTEDEIRLERKRKQKQKQEEYKKLMKEKLLKGDEKPNPRF